MFPPVPGHMLGRLVEGGRGGQVTSTTPAKHALVTNFVFPSHQMGEMGGEGKRGRKSD